MVLTGEDMTKT